MSDAGKRYQNFQTKHPYLWGMSFAMLLAFGFATSSLLVGNHPSVAELAAMVLFSTMLIGSLFGYLRKKANR